MRFRVGAAAAGQRLDAWLHGEVAGLSRSRIQALIKSGDITLDGQPATAHRAVREGQTADVQVPPPVAVAQLPEAIELDILYQDADLVVVNKPAGLVVHPAAGHAAGTLVNALLHHCGDLGGIGGELRPGIVHRLDKDTSGVMVAAKTGRAMEHLVEQFKNGQVRKVYLALVHGVPAAGTVETLIGRSRHDRKKMSARPGRGRRAVTHYEVVEPLGAAALVRVLIETGRTHQIRVHMAHVGCPVVGDRQYGAPRRDALLPAAARQMLHAAQLGFTHPRTGEAVAFEAALPADMAALIEALRRL